MRCFSICTLFFCILSLTAAAPVGPNDPNPPVDPSAPPSRPHTPTPKDNPSVPLPGRSGSHTDARTGVVTAYYGDDRLHEHMGHVQRNQAEFPHNRLPNPLAGHEDQNRANALHNIPIAGKHPVTKLPLVRDEKLPAMLHNPHHATSTTVEYLHRAESNREGGLMAGFKAKFQKAGPNAQGQIRPNPGWLPLHPGQRRGHEAPARLVPDSDRTVSIPPPSDTPPSKNVASKRAAAAAKSDTQPVAGSSTGPGTGYTRSPVGLNKMRLGQRPSPKKVASKSAAAAAKSDTQPVAGSSTGPGTGHTPGPVGLNKMRLRQRIVNAPRPLGPRKKVASKRAGGAVKGPVTHNLRPGHVSPPGHVWHPSQGGGPSHVGAPGHLSEAEKRHPPRPQNHQHYMKQLQAAHAAEANHKAAASGTLKGSSKYLPAQTENLKKFEKAFPARHGGAAGRAHEAPGRMETQFKSNKGKEKEKAPLPSVQGHQSQPSSHRQNPPGKEKGKEKAPPPRPRRGGSGKH